MSFHREGNTLLIITVIILILANGVIWILLPICYILAFILVSIILLLFILQFFRNPRREFSGTDNCINSPADGKILMIEKAFESEFFEKDMLKISIFMALTNVHLNRIPISGKVIYKKYHPGKYLVAFHPKSSELNERNTIVIKDNNNNQILVRQIAGAVARRIRSYVNEKDNVTIGDELGFIKFGSRVDLFLPENIKLNVRLNQKVYANKTVIAFFNEG